MKTATKSKRGKSEKSFFFLQIGHFLDIHPITDKALSAQRFNVILNQYIQFTLIFSIPSSCYSCSFHTLSMRFSSPSFQLFMFSIPLHPMSSISFNKIKKQEKQKKTSLLTFAEKKKVWLKMLMKKHFRISSSWYFFILLYFVLYYD